MKLHVAKHPESTDASCEERCYKAGVYASKRNRPPPADSG